MRWLVIALATGVCALAADASPTAEGIKPKVLLLKSGQRIVYEDLTREQGTLIVRSGGSSLFIDANDISPEPDPQPPASVATPAAGPAQKWINSYGVHHNVRAELIQAVMEVESGYKVEARSRAGAIGLMQLMPGTAKHLKVNPHDPEQNVEAGVRLLDSLLKKYEGRKNAVALALAAYNAGPGAVDRHGGIPPYQETRAYVRKVIARFRQLAKE